MARDLWRDQGEGFAHILNGEPKPEARELVGDLIDPTDPALHAICLAAIRLDEYGFDLNDPEVAKRVIEVGRRRHAEALAAQPDEPGKPPRTSPLWREENEFVYYMRIGNRVKIGWTRNLPSRLATLNPEELLVVEPGNRLLEMVRHDQFADLRTHGEWFRLEQPLIDHIEELRQIAARHPES